MYTRAFGMAGHSNLGLTEAIRLQINSGKLSYVGVYHEGAAAFAASAVWKIDKQARCLSDNCRSRRYKPDDGHVGGKVDRAPVLTLIGQVQTQVFGLGALQDIDLKSAFDVVTRFFEPVLSTSKHAELMPLACKIAHVERDVAHPIFPDDVQTETSDADAGGPDGR